MLSIILHCTPDKRRLQNCIDCCTTVNKRSTVRRVFSFFVWLGEGVQSVGAVDIFSLNISSTTTSTIKISVNREEGFSVVRGYAVKVFANQSTVCFLNTDRHN